MYVYMDLSVTVVEHMSYLMQGTFPLRNSLGPAHSMSSSAVHITGVWFTSF